MTRNTDERLAGRVNDLAWGLRQHPPGSRRWKRLQRELKAVRARLGDERTDRICREVANQSSRFTLTEIPPAPRARNDE